MRATSALAALLLCVPLGLAACGDDDDGDDAARPQAFQVEVTDESVTAPGSVAPGAIEVRFSNKGKRDHSAQIIELSDGRAPAEVLKAGEAWGEQGGRLPEWVQFFGGVGSTPSGGAGTAVVELPPGEYAVFDIEGRQDEPWAEFTVEGDEGEGLPETDGRVEATEYAFESEELEAGSQSLLFENAGEEPHHLVGMPIRPGKTIEDVQAFAENEKGEPPVDESKAFDTAILSGGASAVVDVRLEAGDYAFLCFIPDRAGGPPHVAKGMISAATVK
jgi:hypothetical protein